MTCKKCKLKPVWKFTNQTELCKNCFTDYIERKIFRTVRKYNLLDGRTIKLKKENSLNYNILKNILSKKFEIKQGSISTENLSGLAERGFLGVLRGDFSKAKSNSPLQDVSDDELELYAKLRNIRGKVRNKNIKVQELFKRFIKKNPDLEINIIGAVEQL